MVWKEWCAIIYRDIPRIGDNSLDLLLSSSFPELLYQLCQADGNKSILSMQTSSCTIDFSYNIAEELGRVQCLALDAESASAACNRDILGLFRWIEVAYR